MPTLTDEDLVVLVARIRNGDHAAFREFFGCFYNDVYHFLVRYTCDGDAAQDLTQETFVRFWQARGRLDDRLSYRGYLFRIARNTALNYVTRKLPVSRSDDPDSGIGHLHGTQDHGYRDVFLADDIQKAIGHLPERCRAIFVMSRYHDQSYAEIAGTLSISVQTVKNQMNKAIAVLRKQLADYLR